MMESQEQTYYKQVIARLLEAKARLEARVAELEERIALLEARVASLEKAQALTEERLNRLEQEVAARGLPVEKALDRSGHFLRHPQAALLIDGQTKHLNLAIFRDLWN